VATARRSTPALPSNESVTLETVGPMKLTIDTAKCSGHARCYAVAPEVFDIDDLGYAVPVDRDVTEPLDENIAAGIAACPERAISVR